MGLDAVELVIRIEDTFSIQISDKVAEGLTTPRKVTDFILTQVEESPVPLSCLSQRAFHSLRREFIRQLPLERRQFVPDAKLKEIIPEERRDEIWKSIGSSLQVKRWPVLSRTLWLGLLAPKVQSVRELIDYLVMKEPLIVKGKETAWSRAQVWDVLERVIKDETGVKDFSEDSRFIEDMHLD